ncbi:hypothetical protein HS125_00120 [bacterium]|nr:hypothetical protein [bacterium]
MQRHEKRQPDPVADIPKWTRRYAQSRALPAVWFMIGFIVIFISLYALSHFAGVQFRTGRYLSGTILAAGAAILALAIVIGAVALSVPRWGGRWLDRVLREKLYGAEGHVAFAPPAGSRKLLGLAAAVIFGFCNLVAVVLGIAGHIPNDYMQPVSALYVVPFLVFLYFLLHAQVHPLVLLWPLLYGLHALLIVAGAPILLPDSLDELNLLIPTAGYGLVAGLVAHLYNRHALRRLKEAARSDHA